jgi:dienelactone hydrolase
LGNVEELPSPTKPVNDILRPVTIIPLKYNLIAMAALSLSGLHVTSAQTLQVTPDRAMVDESVTVRAGGLRPGENVAIRAVLIDGAGKHWASEARFLADAQGDVDTSKQAPSAGSYGEVSSTGLIWSMKPIDKHALAYIPPLDLASQSVDFQLVRDGAEVSSTRMEQLRLAEGVRQIKVGGQLHGTLFVPGADGQHPGVLVLGGWEGGVPLEEAAWLASHGFAAFALAYFRYENLPKALEGIPLEYFGNALMWMMKRPEIFPDQIAVMGTTRGAELALQLGSMYTPIKAVVAYTPANLRGPASTWYGTPISLPYAWTWRGQPLAYLRPRLQWDPLTSHGAVYNAAIKVEDTGGPILVICGDDDEVWPTAMMADAIVGRLKSAHFSHSVEVLKYPRAGHQAGRPEIVPSWQGALPHPVTGRGVIFGGTPKGNAESSLDAIPKVLEFLRTNLETKPSTQ